MQPVPSAAAPLCTGPVALGSALVEWIQNDLRRLKPKMRGVAEHLVRQAATLHQQGIENLAQQTRTTPATIVRLAKRYGFIGFSDLKVAFLPPPPDNAAPAELSAASTGARGVGQASGAALMARIHQDLPRLSPKMRKVGENLLGHSGTLHLQRIKPLAQQAGTTPTTIVRLAKRYGFVGFHDLKLAFLPAAAMPSEIACMDKNRL